MEMKKITLYDKQPRKSTNPALNAYHQQEWNKQQQMRQKMRENAAGASGFKSNRSGTPYA